MRDGIGDEIDMPFAGKDHLALNTGALRSGHHEHVRKSRNHYSEIGTWPVFPFLPNISTLVGADFDLAHCSCHRIEAGGKGKSIQFEGATIGQSEPRGTKVLNWVRANNEKPDKC